jgi:hypothetical protein
VLNAAHGLEVSKAEVASKVVVTVAIGVQFATLNTILLMSTTQA